MCPSRWRCPSCLADLSVRESVYPTPSSPSIWLPIWETNSKLAQFLTIGKQTRKPTKPLCVAGLRAAGRAILPQPVGVWRGCSVPPHPPVLRAQHPSDPPLRSLAARSQSNYPNFSPALWQGANPPVPGACPHPVPGACPLPVPTLSGLFSRAVSWKIYPCCHVLITLTFA